MPTTYRFRVHVGPPGVQPIAALLRMAETATRLVVIEGTEHIHVTVVARDGHAADMELLAWAHAARLSPGLFARVELLGTEAR
jgi:hypothetical protein